MEKRRKLSLLKLARLLERNPEDLVNLSSRMIDSVIEVIEKDGLNDFNQPVSFWLKLRGFGPKNIEEIKALGWLKQEEDPFKGLSLKAKKYWQCVG